MASTLKANLYEAPDSQFDDMYEFPTHLLPNKLQGKRRHGDESGGSILGTNALGL
jgi:hypothetical protein